MFRRKAGRRLEPTVEVSLDLTDEDLEWLRRHSGGLRVERESWFRMTWVRG